jgi:LPS sulfotransferase NodH
MFIIKRTNQGGGFVAPAGHPSSYVQRPENARTFDTLTDAERNRCPNNEIVMEYFPATLRAVRP